MAQLGWKSATRFLQRPKALRDRGNAFLAAGDFVQAQLIADQLLKIDLRLGLHLEGQVLAHEKPHDDHTDFWSAAARKCPSDPDFLRKTIHAALKAQRMDVAEEAMRQLMLAYPLRGRDSNFIIGLSNFYQSEKAPHKIRGLVRRFLKRLRGGAAYRIAALRLSRIIFASFPKSVSVSSFDGNFRDMLRKTMIPAQPKALLTRTVMLQQALTEKAQLALFDTDVSVAQCRAFISLVRRKLETKTPFSFVRLGDGESSCLPYEPYLAAFAEEDAADRERTWWGGALSRDQRATMSAQVAHAVWTADCIGIPTVSRILRDIKLEETGALENGRTGRGLRAVLHAVENLERFRADVPIFTSCHLHQDIARWDLYGELFNGIDELVLVSCHPGLSDIVAKRFNVKIAANILVSPRHASLPHIRDRSSDARPLPEMLMDVMREVEDVSQNRLVLVGTGYLGKLVTEHAKRHGGVALDLGSIFDYWMGIATRSYVDLGFA
jgi:hypothetical protein